MSTVRRRESELYEPLRRYLEGQGYSVHAEVRNCDLVARRALDGVTGGSNPGAGRTAPAAGEPGAAPEDVIVIELKSGVTLDLMIQAARRKELSDSVYVAVPLEGSRGRIRNLSGVKTLLRRLEIGLMVVRFLRTGTRVEVLAHPRPFTAPVRHRRRIAMVREIDGRYAEFDRAGQSSKEERITAYKQQSLLLAHLLREAGESSPAALKRVSGIDRAGAILSANMYGWFERVRRGVYRLSPDGEVALGNYRHVVARIRKRAPGPRQ
jgi:hypothetical protein